jgi:hypothetical protein
MLASSPLQPHATATIVACGSFADQFDPSRRKRIDELHQRIDVPAHDPAAGFHALDRGQRKSRALGKFTLIDVQQCPSGPHLGSSYHVSDIKIDALNMAIQVYRVEERMTSRTSLGIRAQARNSRQASP